MRTAANQVWLMDQKMTLPRAVREQAERAEAAHLALLANTPTQPVAPQEPVALPVEPVAAVVTPEAPVVVTAAPVETPVAQPAPDSWELKYKVLNGKYTAEVPRLAQEIRELTERLRVASTAAPVVETASTTETPESIVSKYGEDFVAAVDAIATAKTSKLRDELSSKVDVIEVDAGKRARSDFMRDLTALYGNWQSVDQDEGFTAYLDEFDAQAGRTRREFFNEADRACDAARVASFFAAYAKGKQPAPKPVVAVPVVAPSVEHLISPDSSRSSEAPPGKKHWTQAEVQRFYADSRAQGGNKPYGRYTAAEYARIDSDIDAAISEGRYGG